MSDRYTLPAELGGHTCGISSEVVDGYPDWVEVVLDDTIRRIHMIMPRAMLTPVKPPLPEEPGPRSVVTDRDGWAWQHSGPGSTHPWFTAAPEAKGFADRDWQGLNEWRGPLTLLVPDPFGEPVELPWRFEQSELRHRYVLQAASVVTTGADRVVVVSLTADGQFRSIDLPSAAAREFARAVLAAATQAERNGEHEQ